MSDPQQNTTETQAPDEYAGQGGLYEADPDTGKRTLVHRTQGAHEIATEEAETAASDPTVNPENEPDPATEDGPHDETE